MGIEPTTYSLATNRSTAELVPQTADQVARLLGLARTLRQEAAELERLALELSPTAAGACGSWPPSCSRAPSAECSVISVFPQTQSSSRLHGRPPSSTTPGLVDLRSASRVEPLDSCVRSVLIAPFPALRDTNMMLGPRLFAGLLAHRTHPEGPIARY